MSHGQSAGASPPGPSSLPPDTHPHGLLRPVALGASGAPRQSLPPCRVRALWTPGRPMEVGGLQVPVGGAGGACVDVAGSLFLSPRGSGGSLGVTQRELCSPVTAALVSSGTCLSRLHSPCVASCCGLNSYLPASVGPALARCFLEMPALPMTFLGAFSGDSVGGNPPVHVGDVGSIPGPGRPYVLRINSAWALQLLSLCPRAQEPQLLSPHSTSTEDRVPQSPCSTAREATAIGSPRTTAGELPPLVATREKSLQP